MRSRYCVYFHLSLTSQHFHYIFYELGSDCKLLRIIFTLFLICLLHKHERVKNEKKREGIKGKNNKQEHPQSKDDSLQLLKRQNPLMRLGALSETPQHMSPGEAFSKAGEE